MSIIKSSFPALFSFYFAISIFVLHGCTDISASNPYDPVTPTAQQVKGNVSGTVNLQRFSNANRLQAVDVQLSSTGLDSNRSYQTSPDSIGKFEFSDIPAGTYIVKASAVGFQANQTPTFTLAIGSSLNIGVINLAHQSQTSDSVWFRGQVLLNDQSFHGGTAVQLKSLQDNQSIIQLQTDADGRFSTQVSPNEVLEVNIERRGYITPSSDDLGQFAYLEDEDNFVDEDNLPLSISLERAPISGDINIPVNIIPKWIPVEQRYVKVAITRIDGNYQKTIEAATDEMTATFADLPAGRYLITISRSGFREVSLPVVSLNEEVSSVSLEEVTVELASLEEANIDLDGHRLDVCELRATQVQLKNGDFSGAELFGFFGPITAESGCSYCEDPLGEDEACAALDMSGADFTNVTFSPSDPDLMPASLHKALMSKANFFGAHMQSVDASGGDFSYANFFALNGHGINFANANLENANFTNAQLENSYFTEFNGFHGESISYNGQTVEHPWAGLHIPLIPFSDQPCTEPSSSTNLFNTNFAQANLSQAYLAGVNLSQAILSDAIISEGDLRGSCLINSSLNLTDISKAVLDLADLTGAMMINTVLYKTNLRGVRLDNATLTSAIIEQALFNPLSVVSYGDMIDNRCEFLPSWQDYYPVASIDDSQSNCDDLIDNDADGYADLEDPSCRGNRTGNEASPACTADNRSEACRCRSSMVEANLNGANLVGSRFDGADLTRSSLLGLTVGSSLEPPVSPPFSCDLYETEACFNFCPILSAAVATLSPEYSGGPSCNPRFAVPPEQTFLGLNTSCNEWSAQCLEGNLGISQIPSLQVLECLYHTFNGDETACLALFDESLPNDAILACYSGVDVEEFNERSRAMGEAPLCSFEMIRETLELEYMDRTCEVDESQPDSWTCCPRSRIPNSCTQAQTSFAKARLAKVQMSGVDLTNVILNQADLSESNLNSARISKSNLSKAVLDQASLRGASINKIELNEVSMRGADMSQALLSEVALTYADITGANFEQTRFNNVTLDESFWDPTDPESVEQVTRFNEAFIYGGSVQNDNNGGERNNILNLRLPGAEFNSVYIENLSFGSGDLSQASFVDATLSSINFSYAYNSNVPINLNKITFERGLLSGTVFRGEQCSDQCDEEFTKERIKSDATQSGRYVQLVDSNFSKAFIRENLQQRLEDSRSTFDRVNLSLSRFSRSHFRHVKFVNTYLEGSLLDQVFFENEFVLRDSYFNGGGLSGELMEWNIASSWFDHFDFLGASIRYSNMYKLHVYDSVWHQVSLIGESESGLRESIFESMIFSEVSIKNSRLDEVLFRDIKLQDIVSPFGEEGPRQTGDCIDNQCAEGQVCVFYQSPQGTCRARCTEDSNCEADEECNFGVCTQALARGSQLSRLNFEDSQLNDVTFDQISGGGVNAAEIAFRDCDLNDIIFSQIDTEIAMQNTQLSRVRFIASDNCGSKVNFILNNVTWSELDTTGICNDNLPDSLRYQDLSGVSICDRHRNELENEFFNQYTGDPIWISCNPVYCPNDPECQ